jgi:hypothetical protein
MPIRCRVKEIDYGIFIDRIETQEDAISLRNFFREAGQQPVGPPADCQILLFGVKMEQFAKLVDGANIELISTP